MSAFTSKIQPLFEAQGAHFNLSGSDIESKVKSLKGFIFDWDGVFNNGVKLDNQGSPFSEIDSMGLNMLRFSYYLAYGYIPAIYIVTGENNQPALQLSRREHFSKVCLRAKTKTLALKYIIDADDIEAINLAFVYDDILDAGLAREVGLRFFISGGAAVLFNEYTRSQNLVDYESGKTGESNAVREICELCIGALGNYEEVVNNRVENSDKYREYLELRNSFDTKFLDFSGDKIKEISYPQS